ncbi:uncharacterized protein TNCV_3709911 [Trichonephila clavipes]|nr:uncharacterized protein TNCV_3709911 [Trichonephila clavipes]
MTFLQRYHDDGDELLDRIVTGDATRISPLTPETKQQSMHWRHSGSPFRSKFKQQTLSVRKVMCTLFWDRKGILIIEFLTFWIIGETVNADRFCNDEELKTSITRWFHSQVADFYDRGIQKLIPRFDKCLNSGGGYVEK